MPRQSGTSVQNKFLKGLITEATALSFPEDACTETDNTVFNNLGEVTPRLGFDTEASYTSDHVTALDSFVYTEFVWTAVAGSGDISFLVTQRGTKISFYNISSSAEISGNKHSTVLELTDYLASESTEDPASHECQFTAGNGNLFVVNPTCDPFYVTYDVASDTFTAAIITLSQRDFEGLDDGLEVDERITDDTTSATINPNHQYNLINQGWGLTDALTQWDTARTDVPSNADYVELYRNSATDAFDNTKVTAQSPGNRPAPKGHFILEVSKQNRQEVFEAEGHSAATTSPSFSLIDGSVGTIFTDFTLNTSAAFDGNINQNASACAGKNSATDGYIGKNFGSSPKSISRINIYGGFDSGFTTSGSPSITLTLYGKNSLPASGTDGTSLGTLTFTDELFGGAGFIKTVTSNDITTQFQYVWVYVDPAGTGNTIRVAELQIISSSLSFERPSCIEFYAGRVFYGGVATTSISNNIYFSQIIEGVDQYGKCYQKNDPTSTIPDLLPDDGGVIKIPDMGTLRKLYAYQNALLVYASNGVWLVSGSSGSNFKATDYVVKKISSIGMNSPLSLTSIRGLPAWWGEDGIYTVTFDPNYDSFTPTSISLNSINTLYFSIPLKNKRYVKGTYDEDAQIVYWLYNTDDTLSTDFYKYDSVLVLDSLSNAFYTWSISPGPLVRGFKFIKPADRSSTAKIKYLIHRNYNSATADQTYGECLNTDYADWVTEGTNIEYTPYFITGYKLDGQTQRYFQPGYVFVFLNTEENASCFMQAVFDFTNSSNSGKWSSKQQIYNDTLQNRNINFRRLKVRGKGRALQLRFEGEPRKPFNIIGWSIWETSNATI